MLWLIVAVISYALFSLVSIGDKYLLVGPPNPKIYSFYVGILGMAVLLLIPFTGFYFPGFPLTALSFATGLIYILAVLFLYESLERFEVSRIIPALGGFLPIFTLIISVAVIGQQAFFGWSKVLSFCLLILGSIFISLENSFKFSLKSLVFAASSALLLSLYFVISKVLYAEVEFWTAFIWIRIGSFFAVLFLIFFKDVRMEILKRKTSSFTKKTGALFILIQSAGAGAVILQSWAISLADALYIPFVSALQGTQYIFLFLLTSFISLKSPGLLEEKISKRIIAQKITAIILIAAGLTFLVY